MYACLFLFFFFKQKTAYEMRISDWSSDVCSSDLTKLSSLAQQTLVVPESKDLLSLIGEMRRQRIQLAAVIDEYGGLAGIVTDEDVLEELEIGRASCRERGWQSV